MPHTDSTPNDDASLPRANTTSASMSPRTRDEQVLRESSEILERIFSTTHFSMVYLDRDFNFIRVNKAYADACGYPPRFLPRQEPL